MSNIASFITEHFLVFLIIEIILVFALLGYIIEKQRNKDIVVTKQKDDKMDTLN